MLAFMVRWTLDDDIIFLFFFFSSRRRHTRSDRDWSSDVCSSDLSAEKPHRRADERSDHDGGRKPEKAGHESSAGADRALKEGVGASPPRTLEEGRSEEHTSELQSRSDLVCRLLLEKKKQRPAR